MYEIETKQMGKYFLKCFNQCNKWTANTVYCKEQCSSGAGTVVLYYTPEAVCFRDKLRHSHKNLQSSSQWQF